MRIGVVGAGALGGTFAALLDRAGHDVRVTARGDHLAAILADGLRLDGGYGEHLARIPAGEVLEERPDLALLAVKAQDAVDAARANSGVLAGVPVVVVQNGVAGPQMLRAALPDSPLVGAASLIAASFLRPGLVTVTTPAATVLAAEDGADTALRLAAGVLGEVVEVRIAADLIGLQWAKLVVNQLNAAPAITGLPVQEALRSTPLVVAITTAMRETVLVADAAGIRLAGLPSLPPQLVHALRSAPVPLVARLLRRRVLGGLGDVPNPGSTLQSIRRGRASEIDHLSGAVVAEARRQGLPTPVNRRIVDLVHAIEATGTFVPPDEAARRLLP